MKKPDLPIIAHPRYDYGLCQRLARILEPSPLHIASANLTVAWPDSLPEPKGAPLARGEWWMPVELALLTDGSRGWLVLCQDDEEWDVESEMEEAIAEVVAMLPEPRPTWVIRSVFSQRSRTSGPCPALRLEPPGRARARLETEFERVFESAPPAPALLTFLEPFRVYGEVMEERDIREWMNEAPETSPDAATRAGRDPKRI